MKEINLMNGNVLEDEISGRKQGTPEISGRRVTTTLIKAFVGLFQQLLHQYLAGQKSDIAMADRRLRMVAVYMP
jgi:hypothetical protein